MTSAAVGFPHPALPLELTRASLHYLDVSTLLSLASTSKPVLCLLEGEAGLWRQFADRRMLYFGAPESNLTTTTSSSTSTSSSSSAVIAIPSSSLATTRGGPHPFAAVFPDGEGLDGIDFVSASSRVSVAAFHALRTKAIDTCLAPLLENEGGREGERGGGKMQPCLISTYFQAFDVLVTLRADDAVDAILQAQRRRLLLASTSTCPSAPFSSSSLSALSPSLLSPLAVLLALHLLYRSLPPSSFPPSSSSCCAWRRRLLSFLAQGPFQGLAVVAFWTMGSHNPQNGFRARDILKTEKLDLRRVASLLVEGGREGGRKGGAIEETEGGREEEAVERALAKLESLRGMMPTVTLSPAVVYVGGVEDDNSMCVNAQGFFALSSSPPRR